MGLTAAQKKERSRYLETNLDITECSLRKPYAFISYASDNWETVFKTAVVPLQKQHGLRVYADKAFDKVNDKWIVPMLRNVRGAELMIAFVSQSYIESYACFLELLTAVNSRKQIIFVSLGDQLHLGDTTDQPSMERGAKSEILNQGSNLATNTNNTSNDIMRAMKSAYTSLSTLLEQDALSKYDISDAFINFFRDASINQKTIHDLNAVLGTISSISCDVFDPSLIAGAVPTAGSAAPAPEVQPGPIPPPEPEQVIEAPGTGPNDRAVSPEAPEPRAIQSTVPRKETVAQGRGRGGGFGQIKEKIKANPAGLALTFGILSFLFACGSWFFLSLLSSVFSLVYGVKGLKTKKKVMSIIGMLPGGLFWLLVLLGVLRGILSS